MRTVKVGLEADVAGYDEPVEGAILKTEKLDRKVKDLDKDLDKLGRDSLKTGAEVGALGEEAKKASEDVDKLGKKTDSTSASQEKLGKKTKETGDQFKLFSQLTDDAGNRLAGMDKKTSGLDVVDKKITELKKTVKTLGEEFDKTGNVTIFDKIGKTNKDLDGLKRIRQTLSSAIDDGAKESNLFSSLKSGFEGGLTSPAGLGLAGVAAVPALAAAGGLALGGIGVAGAGAGVAAAVMGNPQAFQAAWTAATGEVEKDFLKAGNAFTGPTMDAIKTIGPTIDSWHLDKALAPAAKYVPVIVDGVERAATGLEKGFASAVAKAGPAVAVLSDGLAELGQAGGDALSNIADGAEGGAQALHDVITVVAGVVEIFGYATEGAEKFYGFLQDHPIGAAIATGGLSIGASLWANALGNADDSGKRFGKVLDGVTLSGSLAADQAAADAAKFKDLSTQLDDSAMTADKFAAKMVDKVVDSLLAADHATLSWHESLTRLSDSFKQNGKSLDENTAKGQANVEAILASVEANRKQYDVNIASGQSAQQATAAYDQNTAALEKQLRQAGLTQKQIDGLIGKYAAVPDGVDTNIALHGFQDAIYDLEDTLAKLFKIDGYVAHAHVVVDDTYIGNRASTYSSQVPKFKALGGIERKAADGMLVPPRSPGWTLFGEPQTGGEAFIPLKGISPQRAMGLSQVVGDSYGFNVTPWGQRQPSGGGGSTVNVVSVGVTVQPGSGGGPVEQAMSQIVMEAARMGYLRFEPTVIAS